LAEPILEVHKLQACYGRITALRSIDFFAQEAEIVGIVGPNGAGKITLLEAIAGTKTCAGGTIRFMGHNIERWHIRKRRELGLMLVPQEGNIFPLMSVKKNLDVSVILNEKEEREKLIHYVYDLFPVLQERRKQIANTLSGGQQRMLAVGIGIASNAQMMLIDEPSIGLAPKLVTRFFHTLKKIRDDTGKTIVLSEQNIKILEIADRLFGLEAGEIKFSEKRENLSREVVKDLYLGAMT
jgi:branched-chain amino acid transport system ATP-binding protein